MEIRCKKCGDLTCHIVVPAVEKGESFILRKALSALAGGDAGPVVDAVLNPTPENVRDSFSVRCRICGPEVISV